MSRESQVILLLAGLSLALTLPTLGGRDITTSHEGRVVQTARRMADSGWPWNARPIDVPAVSLQRVDGRESLHPDPTRPPLRVNPWLVPVMSGKIRLEKPPLPYWITAISFKLLGVNEFAARVVPAILGGLLVLIVADLARKLIPAPLFGDRPDALLAKPAIWAAVVWISTHFILDEFRKAMADPYLAFFAIAAVWAGIKEGQKAEGRREKEEQSPSHARGFILLPYVFTALGFLSKGPAIVVPVIAGLLMAWSIQRPCLRWKNHLPGLLLFLLIALPWYLAVYVKIPNALDLWRYESLGGFGEKNEKPQPFWFYLPQLMLITLPWTPIWVMGIARAVHHRRFAALIWQGGMVLVFSLITQKKNAYLLPAVAGQTLIVLYGVQWLLDHPNRRRLRDGLLIGAMVFAVVIAAVLAMTDRRANARSARAVSEEVARRLPGSGATLDQPGLPPDAAFYLPLDPPPGEPLRVWTVVDDRRNDWPVPAEALAHRFPGKRVLTVRRVAMDSSPADFRWKVFELTLSP